MSRLKKSLSLLLALVMAMSCMSVGAMADGNTFDANATAPTITTEADLRAFAEAVNGGNTFEGKTVTLAANIDLQNAEWTPIGTEDHPFRGVFDGKEKTISNFRLSGSGSNNPIALFGYIKGTASSFTYETALSSFYDTSYNVTLPPETIFGCEVKNLTVSNVTANTTADGWTAAAVAYCVDATVKGVTVENSKLTANAKVGGVVAFVPNDAAAFIDDCKTTSDVTVTASTGNHAAGILGRVYNISSRVIISNCTNNATISSAGVNGGGITGQAKYTLIYSCINNGAVTGVTRSAGIVTNTNHTVIIGCTNNGTITSTGAANTADNSTAGIDAYSENQFEAIVNCTNNGAVTAKCTGDAILAGVVGGGVAENEVVIQGCSNTGTLTNAEGGKVYTISKLSGVPTPVEPTDLAALNTALAGADKNVEVTSNLPLQAGACTITPTAQEILTFVNSPACLTIDLSNVTTSSLQVNVSNATISVVGSYDKSDFKLDIVGSGNNITYADSKLNLKYLYVTNDNSLKSEVTVSAYVGRLVLAGTGKVEATVTKDTTIDQVNFATADGTYTLNNYGTIGGNKNQHTVSTYVDCDITVNNHGTIAATGNDSSYALLFENGCTVVVNEYQGSSYSYTTDWSLKCYKSNGANVTFKTIEETASVGELATLGGNMSDCFELTFRFRYGDNAVLPEGYSFAVYCAAVDTAENGYLGLSGSNSAYANSKVATYKVERQNSGEYWVTVKIFAKYIDKDFTLFLRDTNNENVSFNVGTNVVSSYSCSFTGYVSKLGDNYTALYNALTAVGSGLDAAKLR